MGGERLARLAVSKVTFKLFRPLMTLWYSSEEKPSLKKNLFSEILDFYVAAGMNLWKNEKKKKNSFFSLTVPFGWVSILVVRVLI